MDYTVIYTIQNKQYRINEQHRNNNPNKSQWIIDHNIELEIFEGCIQHKWLSSCEKYAYGLLIRSQKPDKIGKTATSSSSPQELYIAKFCCDQNIWHGFPCGDKGDDFEKISDETIINWRENKYFSKKTLSKINKGLKI